MEELIKEFQLFSEFKEVVTKWGGRRNCFNIYVNSKKFPFYGSVADYEAGKDSLDDKELLFAFKCILHDAFVPYECSDVKDFMSCFGYEDKQQASMVYGSCKSTNKVLNLDERQLRSLLDRLSDLGIE